MAMRNTGTPASGVMKFIIMAGLPRSSRSYALYGLAALCVVLEKKSFIEEMHFSIFCQNGHVLTQEPPPYNLQPKWSQHSCAIWVCPTLMTTEKQIHLPNPIHDF